MNGSRPPLIAIACGGTGGHLFPGVAVGEELLRRGCSVTLMVSPKDVDQEATRSLKGMEIATLPAVGWASGHPIRFARGFMASWKTVRAGFTARPPAAVVGMGGFTSAAPILAGKRGGSKTFLHESNTIPGRANRWLARLVDGVFTYFPTAAEQLPRRTTECLGMPVRAMFWRPQAPAAARGALGLNPDDPVLLITGGSQGAHKFNEMLPALAPRLRGARPGLQFFHLTGNSDFEAVAAAYRSRRIPAVVHRFFGDMATALAAADAVVSRAGAGSLAELAARRVPSILIPYPHAADNHQFHNAQAFAQSGAARVVSQAGATPDQMERDILNLLDPRKAAVMRESLGVWANPGVAAAMADKILQAVAAGPPRGTAGNGRAKPQNSGTVNV